MKKIMLSFAMLAMFGISKAQDGFSKGNTFATGSLGISSQNDKDAQEKQSSFGLNLGVGHFFSDNIAVGVGLGFGSSKSTDESTSTSTTTKELSTVAFGAFGRYYFSPKSKFSMFGHLGVGYTSANDKIAKVKANGMDIFAAPGFNYFVSKNLSLEAVIGRIGYSSVKSDVTGAKGTSSFDFGIDLTSVTFGMNVRF